MIIDRRLQHDLLETFEILPQSLLIAVGNVVRFREDGRAAFHVQEPHGPPEDEAQLTTWVRNQAIAERFVVVNDSELVVAAGTPEGWGVALISGAGSVCLGRSPQGRTIRVGGWGHLPTGSPMRR